VDIKKRVLKILVKDCLRTWWCKEIISRNKPKTTSQTCIVKLGYYTRSTCHQFMHRAVFWFRAVPLSEGFFQIKNLNPPQGKSRPSYYLEKALKGTAFLRVRHSSLTLSYIWYNRNID
jgi:hypothetical protein